MDAVGAPGIGADGDAAHVVAIRAASPADVGARTGARARITRPSSGAVARTRAALAGRALGVPRSGRGAPLTGSRRASGRGATPVATRCRGSSRTPSPTRAAYSDQDSNTRVHISALAELDDPWDPAAQVGAATLGAIIRPPVPRFQKALTLGSTAGAGAARPQDVEAAPQEPPGAASGAAPTPPGARGPATRAVRAATSRRASDALLARTRPAKGGTPTPAGATTTTEQGRSSSSAKEDVPGVKIKPR